jgi:Tfp pilus assembly protein PilN
MKNISLLPVEIKQYHRSSKKRNVLIIIALVILALFIMAYLGLSMAAVLPQQQLKAIRQERAEIQSKIAGMQQYEEILNNAKGVEAIISEAMSNNPDWSTFLKTIYNEMPQDVWITGFTTEYENNAGSLKITGKAESNNSVSRWLSKLESTEGIADVKCNFTSTEETEDNAVSYEISAAILPGSTYQLPDVGGDSK